MMGGVENIIYSLGPTIKGQLVYCAMDGVSSSCILCDVQFI